MVVVAPPPPPVTENLAEHPLAGADQTAPVSEPTATLSPAPVGSARGGTEAVTDCVIVGVPEAVAPRESDGVAVADGVGVGEHCVM